ncbi:uncharacterized protein [Triticum aestivum]|uniref:uncharacterized protein n=1 Tax=Triticum aestivum TaxID=4565 RepID=UPI001D031BE9|nr:uncharacterized protein LOC123137064 [Triticum aestivum]
MDGTAGVQVLIPGMLSVCAVPLYFDERLRRRVTSHNRVFLLVLIHAWFVYGILNQDCKQSSRATSSPCATRLVPLVLVWMSNKFDYQSTPSSARRSRPPLPAHLRRPCPRAPLPKPCRARRRRPPAPARHRHDLPSSVRLRLAPASARNKKDGELCEYFPCSFCYIKVEKALHLREEHCFDICIHLLPNSWRRSAPNLQPHRVLAPLGPQPPTSPGPGATPPLPPPWITAPHAPHSPRIPTMPSPQSLRLQEPPTAVLCQLG